MAGTSLKHFGVLGMHWGKRKGPTQKDENKWTKKAMSTDTYVKAYNATSNRLNSVEIPRINNKKEYKDVNFNLPKNKALYAKYNKEFTDTVSRIMTEEMNRIVGPSPFGRKLVVSTNERGDSVFVVEEVKHSNTRMVLIAKHDSLGHFISISISQEALKQESELFENSLKHFGIPGMRWGVRRKRNTSSDNDTARSIQKKHISEMSNEELKKLTTRLQLERQYKDLNPSAIATGRKLVGSITSDIGKQLVKNYTTKAATVGIDALLRRRGLDRFTSLKEKD